MSKKLDRSSGGIEITGHKGTWYVIDEGDYKITPDVDGKPETLTAHLFLLESELYGDEAACLIVNEEKQIVLEDVWNGFDDLEDAGWEEVRKIECPVCKGEFLREDMTFTRDWHYFPAGLLRLLRKGHGKRLRRSILHRSRRMY